MASEPVGGASGSGPLAGGLEPTERRLLMAIRPGHKANLDTIIRAAKADDLSLIECRRRSDGETVVMLAAVGWEDGEYTFTPFAEMANGNPFALYDPPDPDGGFYEEGAT
jgi:hypothetical protein